MPYYLYILASSRNGTLYVGVTNDISRRVSQHKDGTGAIFTRKYGVNRLVYIETFEDIRNAIDREKRVKRWHREWKLALIEKMKPDWNDLYLTLNA